MPGGFSRFVEVCEQIRQTTGKNTKVAAIAGYLPGAGRLRSRLRSIATKDEGYRLLVRPEIVLEVAFDSIQKSDRHDSGFALRFPRIKYIRADKTANDIDTVEKVRRIYEMQAHVKSR